eukprot:TRINITY_DN41846_c0_g1_i1.p1 TRINITY_DN41846_c0_g1~~TRINITY_DN41846_c0_g1_i1.p1  ORF type:complete len:264 (-),score=44.91 TRINITY_DN41846_c0_g1_i1:43-834(-)
MSNQYLHSGVMVGNWFEQRLEEEEMLRKYQESKKSTTTVIGKVETSKKPISLEPSPTNNVMFNDFILLHHDKTNTRLAAALDDENHGAVFPSFGMSASPAAGSFARNIFRVVKHPRDNFCNMPIDPDSDRSVLRFGQVFSLETHDDLRSEKHYVHTQRATPDFQTRKSKHQEVLIVPEQNMNTAWMIEHKDVNWRMESMGKPVPAHEEVVLTHVLSGLALSVAGHAIETAYGTETEVECHTYFDNHRKETSECFWTVLKPLKV